jgi:two-component system OmpR family sensor kinase
VRDSSLQVRLVAGVLVLAAAGLFVANLATILFLQSYLVTRGDETLTTLQTRLRAFEKSDEAPPFLTSPGEPAAVGLSGGFVIEIRKAGGAVAARSTNEPQSATLEPPPLTVLRAQGELDHPFDLTTTDPASTTYRTLVWLHPDGQGSTMVALDVSPQLALIGRVVRIELIAGLSVLALLGLLGTSVVRIALRPLHDVENTAGSIIAAGDLSRRIPARATRRTEIGRVAGTLNSMLGRVEAAFAQRAESEDRLRRFVADASHELRTPIAGIRGFAELYRHGAVTEPNQVAQLLARIEAEATRMGLLVEDLLLLARLDRRRNPDSEPVDLIAIAADAVEGARVIDPDRRVQLVILPEEEQTGAVAPVVLGDEPQLRQVATNLVGNALRHTPPGTPVVVRVGVLDTAPTAIFEVVDQGPGLSAEDSERVFERFYRADVARGRQPNHSSGAGLGLSIVAAIVAAHRGRVEHVPTPGGGATFRVSFPLLSDPSHQA